MRQSSETKCLSQHKDILEKGEEGRGAALNLELPLDIFYMLLLNVHENFIR